MSEPTDPPSVEPEPGSVPPGNAAVHVPGHRARHWVNRNPPGDPPTTETPTTEDPPTTEIPTTEMPAATTTTTTTTESATTTTEENPHWREKWRTRAAWFPEQWHSGPFAKLLMIIAALLLAFILLSLWNAAHPRTVIEEAPLPTTQPVPVTTPSATTNPTPGESEVPVGPVQQVNCAGVTDGNLRVQLFQPVNNPAHLDALRGSKANTVVYSGGYADPEAMNQWLQRADCDGLQVVVQVDPIYAHFQNDNAFMDYLTQLEGNFNQIGWVINSHKVAPTSADGEGTPGSAGSKRLADLVHQVSNLPVGVQIDFFNTTQAEAVEMGERYLRSQNVSDFGDYTEIVFTPDVPDEEYGPPSLYRKVGVTTALTEKDLNHLRSAVVQASDEGAGRPSPDDVRAWVNNVALSGVTGITLLTDAGADGTYIGAVVEQAAAALRVAPTR
jgi:hypothetical protein